MSNINKHEKGRLIIYHSQNGNFDIELIAQGETVWMTQKQMGELFQTTKQNISLHIRNIFEENELLENSVVKEYLTTASDGKKYRTLFYNLDVILSVGYRVNSTIGTQFRQWATIILKDYMVKGFAMDDARLSGDKKGYFEELYERVRSIRTSEKNFYEKIKDIFAATSEDYNGKSDIAQKFFAAIQNMFHYAVHQHTAAELIVERADAKKPKMGMSSWREDEIHSSDVTVAKNYLNELELKQLQLLSEGFLSFAELKALEKKEMKMRTWAEKLIEFLNLHERPILSDRGSITSDSAKAFALKQLNEYEKRRKEQANQLSKHLDENIEIEDEEEPSPFDTDLKKMLNTPPPKKDKS